MRGPSWENLDDFLQTDDDGGFANTAVIHFQTGGTRPVKAIFDDPYLDATIGEYVADTSRPRLNGKETDFAGVTRGDTVVVTGETFDILTNPQPDGTGWAVLELARQDAQL
jgi:hypothetical protein